ncbi:TetR family transcriptional regulator [Alloalcanivorax xenomutans]|uniref:TetR/AcrR family transcriptional regulator n=1 Tax=Alloalcanivorax xenomutans TaxID=1094342 RepID=UPI000BCBD4F6|nr:TetR family transcriptional regulator C-terminal domain-containing protein [Alloalcanivorax xenomutans]MBA4723443.1 TetR family transcriptional regulator C-terminal domain-containing protein [Alcanivorax sp.]SOC14544.1 TetR family transcriptional regulator [Alloalcanivorax xenomutans]
MSTRKSRERQATLIDATIEVLVESGLTAATTRAVTQRAGVGTGLLNHYFRWPELRAAAWQALFEEVAKDQFEQEQTPQIVMERYFREAFVEAARPYWRLWIEATELAASDKPMRNALKSIQARMQDGLARVLSDGCESGSWRLPDPEASALRLGALYDGLAGLLISGISPVSPDSAEKHLRKAFALECGAEQ